VPHVFFNREYIGDCSRTCAKYECENGELIKELTELALGPSPDPPFPPTPEATMTKITDEIACSSQPTEDQLRKLPISFGISSVVNLSSRLESSFFKREAEFLRENSPSFQYIHAPLVELSPASIKMAMEEVRASKKPVLVHCDTGQRALLVSLLLATKGEKDLNEDNFIAWGDELGINLRPLAKYAIAVVNSNSNNSTNNSKSETIEATPTKNVVSDNISSTITSSEEDQDAARKKIRVDDAS
jgi:protein tyrosine phosphatase (PTP) superfamily phosphohydrolase (DUF442 family)